MCEILNLNFIFQKNSFLEPSEQLSTHTQTYKHTHRHYTEKISRSVLKKRRD